MMAIISVFYTNNLQFKNTYFRDEETDIGATVTDPKVVGAK